MNESFPRPETQEYVAPNLEELNHHIEELNSLVELIDEKYIKNSNPHFDFYAKIGQMLTDEIIKSSLLKKMPPEEVEAYLNSQFSKIES